MRVQGVARRRGEVARYPARQPALVSGLFNRGCKVEVYTYSEARQKLSRVLDDAESTGKVLTRRRDGRTYALVPERGRASPLDVPSVSARLSTEEIVALVKRQRGRTRVPERP